MRNTFITGLSKISVLMVVTVGLLTAQPYAYVNSNADHNVSVIDISTNTVIASIPVGSNPVGIGFTPDGSTAYVANEGSNDVSIIDAATLTNVGSFSSPAAPNHVAVTPDGNYIYVVNGNSNTVKPYSSGAKTLLNNIAVGSLPFGITMSPDGAHAYVPNWGSNTVSKIEIVSNTVVATINVGAAPDYITISPDGSKLYVSNYHSDNISVVSTATNTVLASIPTVNVPIGSAISADGSTLLVANHYSSSVNVINTNTNTSVAYISVGAGPSDISITPDGNYAYVVNNQSHNVSVIDLSSNTVVTTIPVGSYPNRIAMTQIGPNETPIADAGADQLIESLTGSENVSLNGTDSYDNDGDILTYSWELSGLEVSQAASFTTTLATGVHTFTLTVNDGNGGTANDEVVISIIDPLIAYWKAEGNGDDGTLNNNDVFSGGSGVVTYGTGADGQGFEFTGSNWMEIADNPSLNIGTGDLAIVMWAKLSGANGIETLLDKRDPNNGWRGYVVYTINNGFVGAQINVGNSYTNWISPINIADNQWHHIVFTIDRDNPAGGYITVDGTQTYAFDPTAYVGDVNNAGPLRIGGRNDGQENWVGCIDDIRLYNHAFTPEEIEDDFDNVTPPSNATPIADAGNDQSFSCVVNDTTVTLGGSGSSDPDGDGLSYSWILEGTEVSTAVSFTPTLGDGDHTFTLTVSDGEATHSDDVLVSVTLDETAPALTVPDNMIVSNDEGVCGAEVSFNIDATDACGVTSVVAVPTSGSLFDVGTTVVNVTASDAAGNTSTSSFSVTVEDNEPPEISETEDITATNDARLCGAAVSFDVSATDNCAVASLVADPESGSFFDVGTTEVTVTATDAAGNVSESTFEITVEDNEAPSLVAVAEPVMMWSPNHKYRSFDVSDFVVSVADNCSDLRTADVIITHVTSDEAENAKGKGDGNTNNDMVIGNGSVDLRSERQGGGNGRVYTIHLAVADEHGNSSTASAQVHVPHNKKSTAVAVLLIP